MENNGLKFGYVDTVTGKSYDGYMEGGEMKFEKPSILDRIDKWFLMTFCNDWVKVDYCLCPLVHEWIWGSESHFTGMIAIYKRKYSNDFSAKWGSASDLRDIDFDYACAMFKYRTGREPNLIIK